MQINIKKHANRPEGFAEGKGRRKTLKSGLYSVDETPSAETIVKMQHELLYLRQEVEFKKNYFSQGYKEVRSVFMGKAAPLFEVIYQTVQDSNNELNVDILCDIAGVSRSGYYAWV